MQDSSKIDTRKVPIGTILYTNIKYPTDSFFAILIAVFNFLHCGVVVYNDGRTVLVFHMKVTGETCELVIESITKFGKMVKIGDPSTMTNLNQLCNEAEVYRIKFGTKRYLPWVENCEHVMYELLEGQARSPQLHIFLSKVFLIGSVYLLPSSNRAAIKV